MLTTITSKSILKSKTFWFNALAFIVVAVDWVTTQDFEFVAEPWFVALITVVNLILRPLSKQPVTVMGGDAVQVENKP